MVEVVWAPGRLAAAVPKTETIHNVHLLGPTRCANCSATSAHASTRYATFIKQRLEKVLSQMDTETELLFKKYHVPLVHVKQLCLYKQILVSVKHIM